MLWLWPWLWLWLWLLNDSCSMANAWSMVHGRSIGARTFIPNLSDCLNFVSISSSLSEICPKRVSSLSKICFIFKNCVSILSQSLSQLCLNFVSSLSQICRRFASSTCCFKFVTFSAMLYHLCLNLCITFVSIESQVCLMFVSSLSHFLYQCCLNVAQFISSLFQLRLNVV